MLHLLNTQWKLPGASSSYVMTWWYAEAASDLTHHVSSFAALGQLDQWINSRRLALQEIYEALEGEPLRRVPGMGRKEADTLLKRRIADALRTGTLVVLQTEPSSLFQLTSTGGSLPLGRASSKQGGFLALQSGSKSREQVEQQFTAGLKSFEIHSSAGPVAKVGTVINYSVHQLRQILISQDSQFHVSWSVENDPAAVAGGLKKTLNGPEDSWEWKVNAAKPGVHLIKAAVRLNDILNESLVFAQTVTDDGRSLLHKQIIAEASTLAVDKDVAEWTTWDIIRWKTPKLGDPNYIHEFKSQWVKGYRKVIKATAKKFDLPELVVAGVAYAEVGGDPLWIDDVAYQIRSFDHATDPLLEPMTVTVTPDRTSFGNISTQVRRAAESLGYDPNKITSGQREMIIESLKNSRENIFIAAKHLADLRDIDFKGKSAAAMTLEDIKVTTTRFNRGPDLSLAAIKLKMSYGESITKRAAAILELLK